MSEKLIFPIGFDLEEGVAQVEKDWGVVQRRLQKTIDGKPLTIKVDSKGLEQFETYSDNMRNSINKIRESMKELDKTWNSMSDFEKFDEGGELTSGAQELVQKYNELTVALQTYGKTLGQIASDAKHAAEEEVKALERKEQAQIKANRAAYDAQVKAGQQALAEQEKNRADYEKLVADYAKREQAETRLTQRGLQYEQERIRLKQQAQQASDKEYENLVRQIKAEQQLAANQANRARQASYNAARKQGLERMRILNAEEKSIDAINRKLQIQQQRLQSTDMGSAKFQKIAAEVKRLTEELDKANARVAHFTSRATQGANQHTRAVQETNEAYETQDGYLERLAKRMIAYASISEALSFIQNIRDVTAEFELQRVALGSIIGDLNEANAMFEQIKAAAVKSPFQIKELVTYTKQLAAYKIGTDELFETTQRLADISAGLGVGMDRLVLAYGQIRATGYLRASEVRQLTEAGIPIVEELAKKMSQLRGETVSAAEVMGMISERAISFGMVKEVFDDMTSAGGMFYKMQEKQAETLQGQWSNLQDSISIMYEEIGNTALVNSSMKTIIGLVKDMSTHWDFWMSVMQGVIAVFGLYYATQKRILPLYSVENKAIWAKIKAQKQLEAQNIRALAVGRQLTAHEQRRLTLTKHLRAADYERFIVEKKMTNAQLVRYAVSNRNNKQIMLAIRNTRLLTAEQLANIKSMNAWNAFTFKLGMSMRSLGASIKAIGASMLSFLPIAAIGAVISLVENFYAQSKERKKAIEDVNKATEQRTLELDRIEVAYRDVQKAASKANKEDEAFARQTYGDKIEQLQKIATMLKQYNLANAIDFSVITPENIDTIFDAWIEKLRNVNDLSQTFGIKLAEVANAQQGTIMGWSIFGENLKEDMEDMSESWADMVTNPKFRSELDRMRVYVDEMATTNEDFYKILSDAVGEDAKIALSQKRRNESEYDYYMRVQDAYKKIRTAAMGAGSNVKMLNNALGGTYRAFHAIDTSEFEEDMREVMQEFDKVKHTFENEDPLAIRMAIDEQFTINGWNEWQKDLVIRELNKERLKVGLELIPTVSSSKEGSVRTGIQSILNTEFKGLFTEDELEQILDPESAVNAIEAKMKGAVETIETLNKAAINSVAETNEGALEEIGRLQSEINAELNKDEKDRNDNLIKTNRMQIAAIVAQQEAYEKQIQTKKENAEADYNLAKAAKDRLLAEGLSDVAKDVKDAFSALTVDELSSIKGSISEKFLISDKDLASIKDIGDLYDLWAKNTKALTEEKTKLAEVGMSEATITEEQNRLEQERASKNAELVDVETQLKDLRFEELQTQYEQLKVSLASATTDKERKKIQGDIDALLADEAYAKGAQLAVTRSILQAELLRKNAAIEANNATLNFLDSLPNLEKQWEDLGKRWNFKLQEKGKKGGSGEDPWIILMKNRMSYMQDFQKGVENLSKFMANEAALQQEQLIMLNRGLSLNINAKELTGSREELLKWYDEAIKSVQQKIAKLGGKTWSGLGIEAILSKDTKSRVIKAYQQFLQELFNQKTDFQTKKLQEDMEKNLKKLSDQISRTKTAKEFFDRMLGMTGDKQLSASLTVSIYGGEMGDDLGERLAKDMATKFQEQVQTYFGDIDISSAINKATGEINPIKLEKLLTEENVKKMGKDNVIEVRKIINDLIKANADYATELFKSYEKFFDYEKRMTMVTQREEEERKKIRKSMIPDDQKAQLEKASKKREQEQISAIEIEQLKDTADWEKTFEDLNNLGSLTVKNLISLLEDYIAKKKEAGEPIAESDMKTLMNELNQLRERDAQLDPFATIKASLKDLTDATKEYNKAKKDGDEKRMADAQNKRAKALNKLETAVNAVASGFQNLSNLLTEFQELLGIEDDSAMGEVFNGAAKALGFVAAALSTAIALTLLWNSTLWANPLFAGVAIVSGVLGAIAGVFSAISNAKVRKANEEIKRQQELLDSLAYSYERLEKAQEKAFGSDYISNYQRRLENLQAQQEAYLKQAELERSKGKKADKDKIKEYEEQARDAADAIKDMQGELSEYFLGTDLTSAARDFANAWIDAYKEFGSTTDAMKEKFQDMIQNMIVESFAARIIQTALSDIFDEIDKMTKDGVLDISEASKIADMTEVAVGNIDVGMTNLMNALSQAGLSVRGMGSDLTGISRDIATASEESILGLAAGINTQNFYISQVPTKLDTIIGLLRGDGAMPQGSAITLQDVMIAQNQFLSHLPTIAQHTAETVAECKQIVAETRRTADALERVIKPDGTRTTYKMNVVTTYQG